MDARLSCGLALLAWLSAHPARAETEPAPAPAPTIELVTIGSGDELYEKFGHAAICLREPAGAHRCFNYGVTDFADGAGLAWRFIRGRQKFWVDEESFDHMVAGYERDDREVLVQTLPLAPAASTALVAAIEHDLEPAHREYIYDHFTDNCATRIRDLLDRALDGRLRSASQRESPRSLRAVGHAGLASAPLVFALTDFLLGRAIDGPATTWQAMYYPAVLRDQIATQLAAPAMTVYQRHGPPLDGDGTRGRRWVLMLALAFAVPAMIATLIGRGERLAAAWAALWLATWGVVVWTLVILSVVPTLHYNEVALVLVPFDAALPVLGAARRRTYARVRVAQLGLVCALVALGVLHQPLGLPLACAAAPLASFALARAPRLPR